MDLIKEIGTKIISEYQSNATKQMMVCDIFIIYTLFTSIVQCIYCALVGTFPFNSFLSGFICCVGMCVLTVSLRLSLNSKERSVEQAFGDYCLCCFLLFLVVMNFMG